MQDLRLVSLQTNSKEFPLTTFDSYRRGEDLYYQQTRGFVIQDRLVGPMARPNFRRRHIARVGDQILFDATSETDRYSRRKHFSEEPISDTRSKTQKHLLLFGCSFVFGEGLDADQTLPSAVEQASPEWRAYNYAFGGWGPANALARMQLPFEKDEIPESEGAAIYVYLDFHLRRVVPSLSTARFVYQFPSFRVSPEGAVARAGFLGSDYPVLFETLQWLGNSWILSRVGLDWPPVLVSSHYHRTAVLLRELGNEYRRKFPMQQFYVLFYPGSRSADQMAKYLRELGVDVIDFSNLDLVSELQGVPDRIPRDGHPTGGANLVLARELVRKLKHR